MTKKTVVVLGATGLIGNLLTLELLKDESVEKVRVVVRKPIELQHEKLEVAICNFNDLAALTACIGDGDALFCCIGTTQKQVNGDKEAYRKIDFDIPVQAANIAKQHEFSNYLLVSAIGANAQASGFYLQLKGEVEQAIEQLNFPSFHIFRPSFLLGARKEFRMGEIIAKYIFKVISFLLVGSLQKYKAIEAIDVAKAMVNASKLAMNRTKIYTYIDMVSLSNKG